MNDWKLILGTVYIVVGTIVVWSALGFWSPMTILCGFGLVLLHNREQK